MQTRSEAEQGIGYGGVCAVELFRPEYWARDWFELAAQACSAGLKALPLTFSCCEEALQAIEWHSPGKRAVLHSLPLSGGIS